VTVSADPVVVVGAGPGGAAAALALARRRIPIRLVEAEPVLAKDLRAGTFHPPTVEILASLGLGERMLEMGIQVPVWQIRDRRLGVVAEFDLGLLADVTPFPFRLHCEQHKMTALALEELKSNPEADIRFATRFVSAKADADGVTVETTTAAIVAPAAMWLFRGPLCTAVGVERARPGSEVCATNPGELANVAAVIGEGAAAFLRAMPPEAIALVFLIPLTAVAWFVVSARDSRRFAGGMVVAATAWILAWYPNISALPLPTRVFNAYQGVLPTWVWAFQFPVNLEPATESADLLTGGTLVLLGALGATCLIVGYATWSWRLAAAERDLGIGLPEGPFEGGSAAGPT